MSPAPNDSSESSPLPLPEAGGPRSASPIGRSLEKSRPGEGSMPDNPIQIEIYSRPNCHLCHQAEGVIERVRQRVPFSVQIVNVETDPELEKTYGEQIPVVFINGKKAFKYHVDEAELEKRVRKLWNPSTS